MSDRRPDEDRNPPADECRHEWVPTGPPAGRRARTLGSRCRHCGRYSYRPSPPAEPRRPFLR